MDEWIVQEIDEGQRLDIFLSQKMKEKYSRSQVQKLIKEGVVKVNQRIVSSHHTVKDGEVILMEPYEFKPTTLQGEDIPLNIVYEDEVCLVVDKPAGMVVHPAPGNPSQTLVNAIVHHLGNIENVGEDHRPGIVHRLDKETSGLLVIAKTTTVHAYLCHLFKKHRVEKVYYALVRGIVQHDEGLCDEPVGKAFLNKKKNIVRPSGGKEALTYYKVLKRFSDVTFVEVRPKTGRTHQIRVHFAHMGHPLLGDHLYGHHSRFIPRHALHAGSLGFEHPVTKKFMKFESPLPEDFKKAIESLE